jgi:hypothetical protein
MNVTQSPIQYILFFNVFNCEEQVKDEFISTLPIYCTEYGKGDKLFSKKKETSFLVIMELFCFSIYMGYPI